MSSVLLVKFLSFTQKRKKKRKWGNGRYPLLTVLFLFFGVLSSFKQNEIKAGHSKAKLFIFNVMAKERELG